MRDLLLALMVFGSLPFILKRPFYGILMFTWISLMNPHRLTYGWAYDFPWAEILGGVTIFSYVFIKYKAKLYLDSITLIFIGLCIFTAFTSIFALHPDLAWPQWIQFSKIILMSLLTIQIVETKKELNALMMLIVFSLGFYGLKGGVFSILTGGNYLVFGPSLSFIASNNPLGLALNMIVPIAVYLGYLESSRFIKYLLYIIAGLSAIASLFTYSRGALVGLIAVIILLVLQSRARIGLLLLLSIFMGLALWIAPDKWYVRQQTTLNYDEDRSAVSRLNAWQLAWRIASRHPMTGLGFKCHTPQIYQEYFPESPTDNDFHSVYFGMLGEHGFPGLLLFMLLFLISFAKLRKMRRRTKSSEYGVWYRSHARMLEISLIGYMVSGAFLTMQYFDLLYLLIAVIAILERLAQKDMEAVRSENAEEGSFQAVPSSIATYPVSN